MHRYFNVIETRRVDYNQRIVLEPTKPRFHKDWEWKYDFPEIKRKLYQLILFFYKKFLLYLLAKAKLTDFSFFIKHKWPKLKLKILKRLY